MPEININQLQLPANGQFFKLTSVIDRAFVQGLFKRVKSLTGIRTVIGERVCASGQVENSAYQYSFAAFKLSNPPSFLKTTDLVEIRYGFVLLVDIRNYLGLF